MKAGKSKLDSLVGQDSTGRGKLNSKLVAVKARDTGGRGGLTLLNVAVLVTVGTLFCSI